MVGAVAEEEHQEAEGVDHQDVVGGEEDLVVGSAVGGEHPEVVVAGRVAEVLQEEVEEHLGEADEGVPVEEQREAPTPLSSLTDTPVSSLPKVESLCSSPRIWSQAKPSMEKSVLVWKAPSKNKRVSLRRQSTESGILSDPSWLLVCWVVWTTSILNLVKRSSTLVQQAEPVSAMSPMLLGPTASSMQLNSAPEVGEISSIWPRRGQT